MKIGPYEVTRTLGKGGAGQVYAARGPAGPEVAIKVLLQTRPVHVDRFKREARLQEQLGEAAGFVPVLDAGEDAGKPYLVMPLLPGGTLRERIIMGPLGEAKTVALGVRLATALGRAHALGIVHRDVKPENILFDAKDRPLIADLGIAKHYDREVPGGSLSLSMSAAGTLRGTAGYMAPEQTTDAKTAGPEADVFALGAVLYECLTGRPTFFAPTILEVSRKACDGEFERLTEPRWLAAIVNRSLAPDPKQRFANGALLAEALRKGARRGPPRAVLLLALLALVVVSLVAVALSMKTREPLSVKIDKPSDGLETSDESVSVTALARGGVASVEVAVVSGKEERATSVAPVKKGPIAATVKVPEGLSAIEVRVKDARGAVERARVNVRRWAKCERDESVKKLRRAADAGELDAMNAYADAIAEEDPEAAVAWFRRAADRGFPAAMFNLAQKYQHGVGVAGDEVVAREWYRKSAEAGWVPSMHFYGAMLDLGKGGPVDSETAFVWFKKAAERDYVYSMLSTATLLSRGRGTPKDDVEAVYWYRKAAEKGDRRAMTFLADSLWLGEGTERNATEALEWFRKAASLGEPQAKAWLERHGE